MVTRVGDGRAGGRGAREAFDVERVRHPLLVLGHGDEGRRALARALAAVRRHRMQLTIVHAVSTAPPWWAGAGQGLDWAGSIREARSAGLRLLADARDEVPADVPVVTRALHGRRRPDAQVLEALTPGVHDLLILGHRPRAAPLAGRGRSWLARRSPVPVWEPASDVAWPTLAPLARRAPRSIRATEGNRGA